VLLAQGFNDVVHACSVEAEVGFAAGLCRKMRIAPIPTDSTLAAAPGGLWYAALNCLGCWATGFLVLTLRFISGTS
jgi:hypothetical protein